MDTVFLIIKPESRQTESQGAMPTDKPIGIALLQKKLIVK